MTKSKLERIVYSGAISTTHRDSHWLETVALLLVVFGIGALMLLAGGGQ